MPEEEDKKIPLRNENLDDVAARGEAELDKKEIEADEKKEDDKPDPLDSITESINALGEEIRSIKEQVDERLTPTAPVKDETPEEDDPNSEKYRPKNWKSLREETEETVEQVIERREKEKTTAAEQEKADLDAINKGFTDQEETLTKDGLMPAMKNPDDESDPGRAFRREMYGWASKLETLNIEKVGRDLAKLHETGVHYDVKTGQLVRTTVNPVGQSVPVGSSSARTIDNSVKPSYKDIHRMTMDEIVRRSES